MAVITGHNETVVVEIHLSALDFALADIPMGPDFEVVPGTKHLV